MCINFPSDIKISKGQSKKQKYYQKEVPCESPPIRSLRNVESLTPCLSELSM